MKTIPAYCNDCGKAWNKSMLNGDGVCPECAEEHEAWEEEAKGGGHV